VVKLLAEGVQLLCDDVLVSPFLPSVLQAADGAVSPVGFGACLFAEPACAERNKKGV